MSRFEGLVSVPRWTQPMSDALRAAGISASSPTGMSAEPVVIRVNAPAADADAAIAEVRAALAEHSDLAEDAFSDFICDTGAKSGRD